jgi:sugar (pentulose or hexulose) kinase
MPQTRTYLLGLDLGTSVIKGIVIDDGGGVHCTAERRNEYLQPRPGWIEADPAGHLARVTALVRELTSRAPGPVDAVAAASAAGSTLLTTGDGDPLTNIINWMDRRAAQQPPAALSGLSVDEVRQVTGWPCLDSFPLAHLAWLAERRPGLLRRAGRVSLDTDWLLSRLAGRWALDRSTATTMHLQDQVAGRYHAPFLDLVGITEDMLPQLVRSGAVVGHITPDAARSTGLRSGVPVVAGCFDHPAAARAVGVLAPGQLMLSCGTSWVGFLPASNRPSILALQLLCDPFLRDTGGPWAGMFSVPGIGRTIDGYVREVIAPAASDPYGVFSAAAAAAAPGAGGLRIDLRRPAEPVRAPREKISRAVMEGAAGLLAEQLRRLEAQGFAFGRTTVVGGPSRSAVWLDILARATGLDLRPGTAHSGATGAAVLAGVGTGVFEDERSAWCRIRQREQEIVP